MIPIENVDVQFWLKAIGSAGVLILTAFYNIFARKSNRQDDKIDKIQEELSSVQLQVARTPDRDELNKLKDELKSDIRTSAEGTRIFLTRLEDKIDGRYPK